MSRTLSTLALGLLLVAGIPTSSAQGTPVFSILASGDPHDGRALANTNSVLAFMDVDLDARTDAVEPEEALYLDLDGSRTVSYLDVRLSPFLDYAAGTTVDASNRDMGRTLSVAAGWIASSTAGAWYMDVDGDRTTSAGDLRLSGTFGTRVGTNDADSRVPLQPGQQTTSILGRLGYLDLDSDNARDAREPLVFDLDPNGGTGQGKASPGDLRLTPTGPAVDDPVTRAEFEEALAKAGVQQQNGSFERTVVERETGSSWGTPETVLLLLGLANLVGLVFVYTRLRDGGAPRNPFK